MIPLRRPCTALAAILAIAAPQSVPAQGRIGADGIDAHRAAMAQGQPALADRLAREIEAGLGVADLTCADSALPPPCIEGAALMTPQGIAVVLGEDDSILLAPPAAQPAPVQEAADGEAATASGPGGDPGAAADETAPAADSEAAPALRLPHRERPAAAPETQDAAPAAEVESAPAPRRPGRERAEAPATTPDAAEAPPRPRFGRERPATAPETPDAAQLAEHLARQAGAAPGDIAPEARTDTPDEAATRAAEAIAPAAEALATADEAAAGGTTLTVTEDAARSSAEDFATSVSEALRAAPAQPAAAGKDSQRDLARALLAGLAGYAVGQMVGDQGQVALNSGDRVVITRGDGSQQVLKDDSALMFQPGAQVQTQNFEDGSSRIVVTREDGSRVVTIRDAELHVLRRTLVNPDGSEVKLIDDTAPVAPVKLADLPPPARPLPAPSLSDEAALRRALEVASGQQRRFTLGQIRDIAGVRALVAPINIDAITFDTGSAAIRPDQAGQLAALGKAIADMVRANPAEIFLVEGYTDTVGSDAMNLALSDRRAESLALALTEYFAVPPENLVVQGYGERFLKVPVEGDVRANRRVAVRRVTDLLARN